MPVPPLWRSPCSSSVPTLGRTVVPSRRSRTKTSSRWLVSPGTTKAEMVWKTTKRPSADRASPSDWNLGSSTQQGPLPPSIRKSAPVRRLTTCATELLVASLALQLCFRAISGLLRRHGSEVTGGGRRDRGCAGAVGRLAAGGEAADQAAVHAGAGGGLGGAVPGRAPRPRAAQDRLDAGRGGRRPRPLAAAGDPRPRSLGGRRAARGGARLRAGAPGRPGCRAGARRDRFSQAGQELLRRGTAVHRLGRQGHRLPDRGLAAYVSRHGHAVIDRALYLPKAWTDDPARLLAAHVPPEVTFATKPRLALAMIGRAIAAEVPFAWVAADSGGACPRAGAAGPGGRGRDRARPAAGRQGLRARRQRLSPLQLLGRQAAAGRHGGGDRPGAARIGVGAAFGRRRDQRGEAPRLGLSRAGRPRGRRGRRRPLRPVDAGPAGPPFHRRRRARLLLDLVPGRDRNSDAGRGRGTPLGDRGRLRDRQDRARAGPQRDPQLARLAPARLAGDAGLRHAGRDPPACQPAATPKNAAQARPASPGLIRWSLQEIRRVATRLAQRRIQPARIIAWSCWRRAHQANAQRSHLKRRMQL